MELMKVRNKEGLFLADKRDYVLRGFLNMDMNIDAYLK